MDIQMEIEKEKAEAGLALRPSGKRPALELGFTPGLL